MAKQNKILWFLIFIVIWTTCKSFLITRFDDEEDQECTLPYGLKEEIQGYQKIVNKIVNSIVYGEFAGDTYKSLEKMTDKFGSRLSGTENLEKSIDYMIDEFKKAGLENVHTEDALVPHWVRGYEFAEMLTPRKYHLQILGLGTSIGTPKGGITAEIIAVESFEELSKLPTEIVKGKIVIFVPAWKGYGETGQYRSQGASEASKKGAIASLIRSITPFSIGSPHTGGQNYENGVIPIPTACITVEDAEMLLRLYRNGEKVLIHLEMEDENKSPIISRNTIGELIGSVHKNDSVVIVSGHLDSWDVGVGAMDDGGGCFISWKALEYLKKLNLRPKRTIRAILWTGEEFGVWGGKAYKEEHAANELKEFNFLMESDIGTFQPLGLDFAGNKEAHCIYKEIMKLMSPLNATTYGTAANLPDLGAWINQGFPGASLINANEKYFWFHHSAGDSMLVEDQINLDKGTALFAAASYVIANLSIDIPKNVKEFVAEEHNCNYFCLKKRYLNGKLIKSWN